MATMGIFIKVEDERVGPIMRLLRRTPGVIEINLDLENLDKVKKTAAENTRANIKRGPAGRAAKGVISKRLLDTFKSKLPLSRGEIGQELIEQGIKPMSIQGAIHRALAAKTIKRKGRNVYVITAKGVQQRSVEA